MRRSEAAWKPKRTAEKAVDALLPLLDGMSPTTAWPVLERLQRQWPGPGIEALLKKVGAALGHDEAALKERGLLAPTAETLSVAASMERLRQQAARLQSGFPADDPD